MKKELTLILLLLCSLLVTAQEKQPLQQAIQPKDIYVTFDCVKHIVFPVQVNDIEIGQKDLVMASRLEEAPHVIRLSAQTEGFEEETNLTVVCIDGSVYTYHIRYLPAGETDGQPNIYEDRNKWEHHDYRAEVSDLHVAEFFFPGDIVYGTPGNEASFTLSSYNNQLKVATAKDAVNTSNLFVIDRKMNTYHITIQRSNTSVFTYNYNDQRPYTAHVDVNSEEMAKHLQELKKKKRNIFSLGVIENKFELSMANLYVHEDYMFFVFDLKNNSYIDYDIEFVKCFERDQKKRKNAIQQETTIEPIYQDEFNTKIKGKGSIGKLDIQHRLLACDYRNILYRLRLVRHVRGGYRISTWFHVLDTEITVYIRDSANRSPLDHNRGADQRFFYLCVRNRPANNPCLCP